MAFSFRSLEFLGSGLCRLGWLGVLTWAGCAARPCDPAIDTNDQRYTVSIAGLYQYPGDGQTAGLGDNYVATNVSCQGIDGLVDGAVLSIETIGSEPVLNNECRNAVAELLSAPAQITVLGNAQSPPPNFAVDKAGAVIYSISNVTIGGCAGTLVLEFFAGPQNLFAPLDSGINPPGVMYRLFYPSDASCTTCQDNLVVRLALSGADGG